MRLSDKYFKLLSGYMRFKNSNNNMVLELNWNIYNWAIPLSVDYYGGLLDIRILCLSFIISITRTHV